MQDSQPKFLTPAQVVARWDEAVTTGTLANWRAQKPRRGPPFQKFGSRVRYPMDKLLAWEAAHQHALGLASNDNDTTETDAA